MSETPRRALVSSSTPAARAAAEALSDACDWCPLDEAELVIALGARVINVK